MQSHLHSKYFKELSIFKERLPTMLISNTISLGLLIIKLREDLKIKSLQNVIYFKQGRFIWIFDTPDCSIIF